MFKFVSMIASLSTVAAASMVALPQEAKASPSTFQNTCSNISFAYSSNQASMTAVCLRADGSSNPTSVMLQGIGNNNGVLVQGSGPSTFQKSCGNITITVTPSSATLNAFCRTMSGSSNVTSLPLNGINNNNGVLAY